MTMFEKLPADSIHCPSPDEEAGRFPGEESQTASAGSPPKKRKAKGKSPTARTLEEMRKRGYTAQVVEVWNPHVRQRKDLFGIIDVLCIREGEVVGVQATSNDNAAARVSKIADHEYTPIIRKAGIRILVHGWRKAASGRWTLREIDVS